MKITFRKSTGEVVMIGQGIDNDFLSSVVVQKDDRMNLGYKMYCKDGKIIYEEPEWIGKEKEKKQLQKDFQNDISLIENAKDLTEIKSIITKLATKIYGL